MKTIINALFATVTIAFTVSASPALLIETTITERHSQGGKDVLAAPRITVESGKPVTIQAGKLAYTVTSTLNEDGSVYLSAILTEREGGKAEKLVVPRIKGKLGQAAEIQIGQITLTTKTTLAK